jgi:predicted PurR-regulated permease PerM
VVSLGQLAHVLPQYSTQWQHLLDGMRSALTSAGFGPDQVQQALHSIGPQPVLAAIGRLLTGLAGSVLALVLVLATSLFMIAESTGLPERLATVPGTWRLRAALGGFATNTRRYIVVTTIFGFAVAVVDTVGLVVLGIPLAGVWGLLAFLTNYVPNIGFLLGLLPPVLLALLSGGPGLALLVVVIYSVANFLIQSVLQPVFVGDAVGLSVTLTFLSVVAWTVVLGAAGAVLAVPLTLLFQSVLVAQDPDRRWARILLAGASGAKSGEASARPRPKWRRGGAGRPGRTRRTAEGVPPPRAVPPIERDRAPVSSGQDDAPAPS